MKFRKIIFWLHLAAGLGVGLVVLFIASTGILLAYQRQILAITDGYQVTVSPAAKPLPLESLLEKIHAAKPGSAPMTVILKSAPSAAVGLGFGPEKIIFVNPYTGAILGEGAKEWRAFFAQVTVLHRFLGGKDEHRDLGKAVTGATSVGFLFLVVSGLFLWWPRKTARPNLKLTGKARDWNWHNAVGFWCGLPLLLTTTTGVIMSYTWANNLLFRATGNEPPPEKRPDRAEKKSDNWEFAGLEKNWLTARQTIGPWQTVTVRLPREEDGPVTFQVEQGNGGRPDLKSQLTLDGETGEVKSRETFAGTNWGKRLRLFARFLHTGEAGGFIGQTIMVSGAVGAVLLVCTGFSLAWRRFIKREA